MSIAPSLLLTDRIRDVARHRPSQTAAFDAEGAIRYGELAAEIDAVAAGLHRAGIARGDRVATAMEPSLAYLMLVLGALRLGAVVAFVNTRLTPSELVPYLAPIEPAVVVADATHAGLAGQLGRPTIALEAAGAAGSIAERLAPLHGGPTAPDRVCEQDDALIFPTGGTTGTPKGACYDQRGVWLWCDSIVQTEPDRRTGVELFCSPFFHVTFGVCILARLWSGDTVQILHRFDAGDVLQAIDDGAHRVIGATTMFNSLRDHPSFAATRRGALRRIQFGASPATPQFIAQLLTDYPRAIARSAYGATEFGPVTGMDHAELVAGRVDGVGFPLTGAVIRITDDDGRDLPLGEPGEIRVRSSWATRGYFNLPEQTEATFRPDGIRSGDMGFFDDTGWLHLSGRQKEMIITGGENVFPNEVERVLLSHPDVQELIVYGVDDDHWGERVEAGVVPVAGRSVDLAELRTFGRSSLAGYKLPKSLRVLDAIPLTGAYKPDRKAARRAAQDAPARLTGPPPPA